MLVQWKSLIAMIFLIWKFFFNTRVYYNEKDMRKILRITITYYGIFLLNLVRSSLDLFFYYNTQNYYSLEASEILNILFAILHPYTSLLTF